MNSCNRKVVALGNVCRVVEWLKGVLTTSSCEPQQVSQSLRMGRFFCESAHPSVLAFLRCEGPTLGKVLQPSKVGSPPFFVLPGTVAGARDNR